MNIKSLFNRKKKDEREVAITNQFSAHAFYIVFYYTLISSLVKYLMGMDIFTWFDQFVIIIIASWYILIRLIKSGIQTIPEDRSSKRRLLLSSTLGAFVFGGMTFYLEFGDLESKTVETILELIFKSTIPALIWGVLFYFLMKAFSKKTRKNAEKLIEEE